MGPLTIAGAVLFVAFSVVAGIDGVYFHIWKYKLHTRPESLIEHVTHTLNAVLFPPLVYLLLYRASSGVALWAAVAIIAADLVVESWDVFVERDSRASLGGLTPFEYWLHVMAVTLRVAGITALLAARPAPAWALSGNAAADGAIPGAVRLVALALIAGGTATALQHVWLCQPRYRAAGARKTTGGRS